MSLVVKKTGEDFELAPQGNHVAICYMIIDLGVQQQTWKGDVKEVHKIRFGWELSNEPMSDGRPFAVFKDYTASIGEKANLRKDLESWRGRRFSDQELEGFDVFNVIGAPCMVNVVHNVSNANGNTYANIASVSPLPKGMAKPELSNTPIKFSLDDFDRQVFNSLPDWLQEKINTKGIENPTSNQATEEYYEQAARTAPATDDFDDQEIPF